VLAVESGRADGALVEHPMAMYMAAQNSRKVQGWQRGVRPEQFGLAIRAGDWQWLYWLNTGIMTRHRPALSAVRDDVQECSGKPPRRSLARPAL